MDIIERGIRSHLTMDGRPKKGLSEKDAVKLCYRLNCNPFSIHQVVAYKCVSCGKFHIGHTRVVLTDEKKENYRKKLLKYG